MASSTGKNDAVAIIYVLFPTAGEALDACRKLLAERLVASCFRMAPGISNYEWQGEMQATEEHPVLFKTSAGKVAQTMTRIAKLHSYDVPAILQWTSEASHPDFAKWVDEKTA